MQSNTDKIIELEKRAVELQCVLMVPRAAADDEDEDDDCRATIVR